MLEGAALYAGEKGRVKNLRHHARLAFRAFLAPGINEVASHENDASARAAQGLVGCGGYDMRVLHRIVKQACGDEACRVCHIYHKYSSYFVGKGTHAGVVPFTGIGACSADNQFGTFAAANFFHLLVVDAAGFGVHSVFKGVVHEAGEVHGAAVGEVAAMAQVEADEFVAGLKAGKEHGHIGLRARVGLHVGVFSAKKLLDAFYRERFNLVYNLATAVIASAGIAFGIFVGQARAHGAHHIVAYIVF